MTQEETLVLIGDWLRNDPSLPFKRVRDDARKLHVFVTRRLYSEAKREIGITLPAPQPASARSSEPEGEPLEVRGTSTNPMMNFIVELLRNKPDATYQEVRAAGETSGFQVTPINYGRARRVLGMAPKAKPSVLGRLAGVPASPGNPEKGTRAPAIRRETRRRRKRVDMTDLGSLVGELEGIVAESDRMRSALDQIAEIIRNV